MLPEQDAVTANTGNMQRELNIVWNKLLSAFSDRPFDDNPDEQARLKATITTLKAAR